MTPDVDAVLVPPGDPQALAEGIARVLRDRDLADRLARQAWSRAATFSWAARAERIDQVLQGVVTPAALANAGSQA